MVHGPPPPTYYAPCPGGDGYVLAFDDEFNGDSLDLTKWINLVYPGVHQLIYTSPTSADGPGEFEYYSPNNLTVNDGILTITSQTLSSPLWANIVDNEAPTDSVGGNGQNYRAFNYTSGAIHSLQTFPAGKYEIRCKFPNNAALWPAFWMRFDGWNFSQEIDAPDYYAQNSVNDAQVYHCCMGKTGDPGSCRSVTCALDDMVDDWHILTLEWDRYYVVFKVDGQIVRSCLKLGYS